ncbi:MAG: putative glycosyltransferase [Frankiales bacterium]|nr:putative glycosyltransferase [Frankiales bacterium]
MLEGANPLYERLVAKARWSSQALAEAALLIPRLNRPTPTPDVIVSLTSFPGRIESAWVAAASLLRQSVAPQQVVLVLAEEEFPGQRLPQSLTRLTGLTPLWVPTNNRSYKKLLPVRQQWPRAVVVTADDDVRYPRYWLAELLQGHDRQPDAIIGHRGSEMVPTAKGFAPYETWPLASPGTPPHRVFLKGNGGILYPPGSLPEVAFDVALAEQLCPTADDVWFRATSLLAGTPVRRIRGGVFDPPTSRFSQDVALHHANLAGGANDTQLSQVLSHFGLWELWRTIDRRHASARPPV